MNEKQLKRIYDHSPMIEKVVYSPSTHFHRKPTEEDWFFESVSVYVTGWSTQVHVSTYGNKDLDSIICEALQQFDRKMAAIPEKCESCGRLKDASTE
jgi:hypothetical protein